MLTCQSLSLIHKNISNIPIICLHWIHENSLFLKFFLSRIRRVSNQLLNICLVKALPVLCW
eukprot:XP_001707322.1 Hypothetical protein GL50803_29757 [Giardia lamblia ATCC 50803]